MLSILVIHIMFKLFVYIDHLLRCSHPDVVQLPYLVDDLVRIVEVNQGPLCAPNNLEDNPAAQEGKDLVIISPESMVSYLYQHSYYQVAAQERHAVKAVPQRCPGRHNDNGQTAKQGHKRQEGLSMAAVGVVVVRVVVPATDLGNLLPIEGVTVPVDAAGLELAP